MDDQLNDQLSGYHAGYADCARTIERERIAAQARIAELERANAVLAGLCQERFDQLHEAAHKLATSRAAALEEAAKVCDVQALLPECPERAKYCADSIRALLNEGVTQNDR